MNSKTLSVTLVLLIVSTLADELSRPIADIIAEADRNPSSYFRNSDNIKLIKIFNKATLKKDANGKDYTEHDVILGPGDGKSRTLRIGIAQAAENQVIDDNFKPLLRLQRQKDLWPKSHFLSPDDSLIVFDHVGAEKVGDKIYTYAIEESGGLNLNNFYKGKAWDSVERVAMMRDMARALFDLHANGIVHCCAFLKKFAFETLGERVKMTNPGLISDKFVCDEEGSETPEPIPTQLDFTVPENQDVKYKQDIWSLAISYFAILQQDMDAAIKKIKTMIVGEAYTYDKMREYVETEHTAYSSDDKLPQDMSPRKNVLKKFVVNKTIEIIRVMMVNDMAARPTSYDIMLRFNKIYLAIMNPVPATGPELTLDDIENEYKKKEKFLEYNGSGIAVSDNKPAGGNGAELRI